MDLQNLIASIRGPIADPGPEIFSLLTKEQIAQIKVRQFDQQITQLESHIEILKMTRSALAQEYKVG